MYKYRDEFGYENGKRYNPTYWGSVGKYQKEYEAATAKLVPAMGNASTYAGEILRNLSNFYYDRYNNGHCNPCRTQCAVPVRGFLKKHKSKLEFKINMKDKALDETIDFILETMIKEGMI